MTLVELLISIVIVVLLAAVVFTTVRTVSVVTAGQRQRAEGTHAAAAALDQFQKDLMCVLAPGIEPACAFVLTQRLDRAELACCLLEPDPTDPDLRWARLRRVSYRVEGDSLLRTDLPLTGPGSLDGRHTNTLAAGVQTFVVEVFDGAAWGPNWPSDSTNALPQAVRARMATADGKAWEMETWIPAGSVFTSRVTRASTR